MMKPLTISGTLDALIEINRYVIIVAERAELSKKSAYQLRLAVDEIATNVISHGHLQGHPLPIIKLSVNFQDDYIEIVLEDTGQPYNLNQIPPPDDLNCPPEQKKFGGLGLFLAKKSVDKLQYERVNNWNRHTFIIKKIGTLSTNE